MNTAPASPPAAKVPAMMTVYFEKKILSSPVIIGGAAVPWENIGRNEGVIALEPSDTSPSNQTLLAELNRLANAHRGGVLRITAAEYDEKKNRPLSEPLGRPKEMLRLRQLGPQRRVPQPPPEAIPAAAAPAAAVEEPPLDVDALQAAASPPDPVDSEPFRPPVRRPVRGRPPKNAPPGE